MATDKKLGPQKALKYYPADDSAEPKKVGFSCLETGVLVLLERDGQLRC